MVEINLSDKIHLGIVANSPGNLFDYKASSEGPAAHYYKK